MPGMHGAWLLFRIIFLSPLSGQMLFVLSPLAAEVLLVAFCQVDSSMSVSRMSVR